MPKRPIKPSAKKSAAPAADQAERKQRSLAILNEEQIAALDHLADIEIENETKLRTPQEIVHRLLCCTISAVGGGYGESDKEFVAKIQDDFKVQKYYSPLEAKFLSSQLDDRHERIQFSWRYERSWVLLWSLGYVAELSHPNAQCDPAQIAKHIMGKTVDQLVRDAKPRSLNEVLDANNDIYDLHWTVRDAQHNKRPVPKNLDAGVIMERHAALNWLVNYCDQDWDDITTDT